MKLSEIKQMFAVGQAVRVTREGGKPLTVVGNLGNTVLPANDGSEVRTIKKVKSMEWVMTRTDGRDIHTTFPKASEVLEARTGFVKLKYDTGVIVTIELVLSESDNLKAKG